MITTGNKVASCGCICPNIFIEATDWSFNAIEYPFEQSDAIPRFDGPHE